MTDYLTIARENFIGRRWLYQEIENAFLPLRPGMSAVLIIGDPGAGKSALSAQLICSRTSSRTIHDHVLAYHLCRHSDRNTQNGGKFVRSLADMIARRLPEYGYIVANNSYIQRSLTTDCVTIDDPVGCFEQAILTPLKRLKNKPKENWYIVIDALDECLTQTEASHSIVYLLHNKLPRFPSWMKLVMTSRNESSIYMASNSVMKLSIDPEDSRNMEDIEVFLSTRLLQDGPLVHQIKLWFGDNSIKNTARLVSALLSKSQGNFLFVKEMLHHWETSRAEKSDPYALPETLGELYHSYFERLYRRPQQFIPIRRVLELLVATFHPLSRKEIFKVLKTKEKHLEEEYEFKNRMKELGHFIRYGENDTVTLYHLSLTEWLTSDNNKNGPFYVSKKKGHETFCDYYFSLISGRDKSSLSKYMLLLAQHIAYGGWKESYVQKFLSFPSQVVNSSDPTTNRTLLHLAATINSTDVVKLLLWHFSCIDCVDNRGITPAFLAAKHGLVNNLALLVTRGAKVNRKTKSLASINKTKGEESGDFDNKEYVCTPALLSKSKHWASTMLHAAAHGGHLEVVNFLIENSVFISTVNGVNLTALQLAAENGHLEVVKALYNAGAIADQTALHHAAANGRLEVVKYLLKIGVRDRCMRCDGSFYWLNSRKHRLQSQVKKNEVRFVIKKECLVDEMQTEEHCMEQKEHITEDGELFDDKHLLFCETALHKAVSAGHIAVVRELISSPQAGILCRDYTGRTPLHEAVRKNDTEMVKLLLQKQRALVHETCNQWQSADEHNETQQSLILSFEESLEYHSDVCHCGYTPLHLAARYGHWDIGISLINGRARVDAPDCFGATPLHVAACHNQQDFLSLLMHSKEGANVNSRSYNDSTPLHSAAACSAVEVIDFLLVRGANLSAVDKDGLSVLHYAIRRIQWSQLDRKILLNRTDLGGILHLMTVDRRGHLAAFYDKNKMIRNTDQYRWLDAFINLIIRGSDVDVVDKNGRTPMHIAAANGLADAVNVLLQRKSKLDIPDKLGKTPLEVAVENCTAESLTWSFNPEEDFHELKQHLRDHEMVVYLLLSSGASFKKCNRNGISLIHHALAKRQPYIAQLLLLKGASLNCKDYLGRTPLVAFINNGGDWAAFPFKHLNDSVNIECGKPFNTSAFHLLSYFPPKLQENNFFELVKCENDLCLPNKSPLERAIEMHRLKNKVINTCLDAEGFSALHRAAQGANFIAVRSLLKIGANFTLLSPQGHSALTLAVLHSGGNIWEQLLGSAKLLARKDNASVVALELLHHAMKAQNFQIVCDSSKSDLTLYHLAASRGLVKFVQEILKQKEQHQLDVNCPNKDGVTPLFLAKVFEFESEIKFASYFLWKKVARIIEDHGGKMMFPRRDAECNIIYNRLFGWIPSKMNLDLRPDVRGFVSRFVTTFQSRHTIFDCLLDNLKVPESVQIGFPDTALKFSMLLLDQLPLPNQRESLDLMFLVLFAQNDIKMCLRKQNRSTSFLKKFVWGFLPTSSYKSVSKKTATRLFYLMRMWQKEVFQHFACIKAVFKTCEPILFDSKLLKQWIRQYEESTPLWYLDHICLSLKLTFSRYLLHHLSNNVYSEFHIFSHKFPDFVRERMGWNVSHIGHNPWPFDFLVKFSLGLYSQYDYLKVLNVGLEPKTHIAIHSDGKHRLPQDRMRRRAPKQHDAS